MPQNRAFSLLWKFCHASPKNSTKRDFFQFLTFLSKLHAWQSFCSWGIAQNILDQSDCKIFLSVISVKKLRAPVDFLSANKNESFLQGGAITFGGCKQTCSKYPNEQAYISRKREGKNMIFCLKINHNVFDKLVILFLLVIARHAQCTHNRKFAISVQYIKNEGRVEVVFCVQINIKLSYKLMLLILVGMVCLPKLSKIKSAKCLQYLKKEVRDEVCFLCN